MVEMFGLKNPLPMMIAASDRNIRLTQNGLRFPSKSIRAFGKRQVGCGVAVGRYQLERRVLLPSEFVAFIVDR